MSTKINNLDDLRKQAALEKKEFKEKKKEIRQQYSEVVKKQKENQNKMQYKGKMLTFDEWVNQMLKGE